MSACGVNLKYPRRLPTLYDIVYFFENWVRKINDGGSQFSHRKRLNHDRNEMPDEFCTIQMTGALGLEQQWVNTVYIEIKLYRMYLFIRWIIATCRNHIIVIVEC